MTDKVDMTVTFHELTPAQAIALHAMFNLWRFMGSAGCSRMVSFYVDGDGNFRVKPRIEFSRDIYSGMTDEQKHELWRIAQISVPPNAKLRSVEENPQFDFDAISMRLR